jgi:hypothetical protein
VFEVASDVVHHREDAIVDELAVFFEALEQESVLAHDFDRREPEIGQFGCISKP